MKLLTFSTERGAARRLGASPSGDKVIDAARAYASVFDEQAPDWFNSVADLLRGGEKALELLRDVLERVGDEPDDALLHDINRIAFQPPTADCPKVLCVTMNYLSHAQASLTKPSKQPYFFIKFPNVLIPHRAPVLRSRASQKCDSEVGLAVIIGRRRKYITCEDAMEYVAGYAIANVFSFRDRRGLPSDPNSSRLSWVTLKNLDTAAPIGPWLITKDEISDPYALAIP